MTDNPLYYREVKNVAHRDWSIQTTIYPAGAIVTDFVTLTQGGLLTLRAGFAWDGASGPTQDTPDTIRASAAHDGLYLLLREGHIDPSMRPIADKLLRDILKEDQIACGVSPNDGRADAWLAGVSLFAEGAAQPGGGDPVLVAPRDYIRVGQAPSQD